MPRRPSSSNTDRLLGLDRSGHDVTRRDFLNSTLLASGAAALASLSPADLLARAAAQGDDWTGPGGIGDYAGSNGNTLAVLTEGHAIRDRAFETLPVDVIDTGETYDCVVVGGGISGLASALLFKRRAAAGMSCLVIDNHPIFGGEAKRNEINVDGRRLLAHQGSAFFFVPYPYSFIGRFYESIGLKQPRLTYQTWNGSRQELAVSNTPYGAPGMDRGQYGVYFGAKFGQRPGVWAIDPVRRNLEGAPLPAVERADVVRILRGETRPGFERPQWDGDAISRRLDAMTLEDHLMDRYGVSRELVRTYLADEGGGFGLGPDALSAFTIYAPDMLHPLPDPAAGEQMFADGNSGFARLIVKALLPDAIAGPDSLEGVSRGAVNFSALDRAGSLTRIRLTSTAVWVQHDGPADRAGTVTVAYTHGGRFYRVKARSVVMAGGSWTTKSIVRDLGEPQRAAYAQFFRSPAMMANVAVRNWRFLERLGISGCRWFEGVGSFLQVRRSPIAETDSPTIDPDQPTVLNLKVIYPSPGLPTEQQGHIGRAQMLSTPFREYERQIREQFTEMFGRAGFDAARDIAAIILNRWGHAYVSPQPGWYYGTNGNPAPRDVLRAAPFGRIAFANTDLSGNMDHRSSIIEADRAIGQLLDQVLT
jgi:spermidine dehydrogenase